MSSAKTDRLYLDNAATSFPKAPGVVEAMTRYLTEIGASAGRGAYAEAIETDRLIRQCRDRLNKLIHGESSDHIIFTLNASDAINIAVKGLVRHWSRKGESIHLITTVMEHNSVVRPINSLEQDGVTHTRIICDSQTGRIDLNELERAIRPETKLVATVHASNVTGTIQDVATVARICRAGNVPLLVDAAQSIGHIPIDVQSSGIDLLAFPGHKGLLGPLGTGGLYVRPGVEHLIEPLREGGTGSFSERDTHPDFLPDKLEAGSPNVPGIVGLNAALGWLLDQGVEKLRAHELRLTRMMLDGLRDLPGLHILGPPSIEERVGVVSIMIDDFEPTELAALLEDGFGILTRSGLHCAPLAHDTVGSRAKGGAVRFSVGPFNTEADITRAIDALREICHMHASAESA